MRATRRYWQALAAVVLGVVGVVALVVLLSGGRNRRSGQTASTHGATKAKAGSGVRRIRPIATVNDVTSTGDNEDPVSVRVNLYDLRRQGPVVVLDFGPVSPTPSSG